MQNFILGSAAAFCLAALGGAAASGAVSAEATLAAALAAPKQAVIDGRVWSCNADKCTAVNSGQSQPVVRECARVVRALGAITAYRSGDRTLNADELKACNS